jgi:hypothetical protein
VISLCRGQHGGGSRVTDQAEFFEQHTFSTVLPDIDLKIHSNQPTETSVQESRSYAAVGRDTDAWRMTSVKAGLFAEAKRHESAPLC